MRLLALAVEQTSARRVALRLVTSHNAIGNWLGGDRPSPRAIRMMRLRLAIPETAWDSRARPPPPKASTEILAELGCTKGFHHFLTEGPLVVAPPARGYPLTVPQSALVKVAYDELDPCQLEGEERAAAKVIFGDIETIPESARDVLLQRLGRQSGKTSIYAAYGAFRLLTADLSGAFAGMPIILAILAPSTRISTTGFDACAHFLRSIPSVKSRVEVDNGEEFRFARPHDGHAVSLRLVPRSPKGRELRGYTLLGLAMDEAEFGERGKEEASITDADQIDAARPRFLAGSKVVMLSTPWGAPSWMADSFLANFGQPATALACRGTTLFVRSSHPDVVNARAKMLAEPASEMAARREFDLEVSDNESAWYDGSLVDACVGPAITARKAKVSAGVDLAFHRDFSALVITERQDDKLVVVACYLRTPLRNRPLDPETVCNEFAQLAREAGAAFLVADTHCSQEVRAAARGAGIQAVILDRTTALPAAEHLRALMLSKRLVLPSTADANASRREGAALARELKSIRSKPGPGGTTVFDRPRSLQRGHCDLAAALETAAYSDNTRHGPFRKAASYPRGGGSSGGAVGGAIRTGWTT